MEALQSLEICAGAGGQALGIERAGFEHVAAVEIESVACETLSLNRPKWNVLNRDVRGLSGSDYRGVDLFAGGVPCPPFSVAGRQLGENDERDLFPVALQIVEDAKPRAVILENVPGLATARFSDYREKVYARLSRLGYTVFWQPLNACNFGVPQLRPRFVLVALRGTAAKRFVWPNPIGSPPTVGEALHDLMAARGWKGASAWVERANAIGPTLVGGSKLHGGPDLGPSRAKAAWSLLGVNGGGIADAAPDSDFPIDGVPKLTVRMAARIQGFPDSWQISGRKTAAYRQIGNAFPPPVAEAVGRSVRAAIVGSTIRAEKASERRLLVGY
ncbi:DNA cytosine methyltransferase [Gemmatimonas sp.]|jgi:DNA (cytosine-5)-methyltransferase 1|uniref:DNA cytosine methyltransferase n=1 Tax=Gemmatimonas sp. TaxID=1962908 RepID=UPI0031C352F5|nr:DNA cytosine methyltransferase [Gemmatimonas sp.]